MTPRMPAGFMLTGTLERTPPGDQVHDQDDDRDHQKQVNKRATEMTDESEQPEDQKHNKDSPEHMFSFELVYFASCADEAARLKIFRIRKLFSPGEALYGDLKKVLAAQIWNDYNACIDSNRQPMRFKILFTSLLALAF